MCTHIVVQIFMIFCNTNVKSTVLSQMTDVPDNRTSQMADFKQTEEVYKITVFF